MGRSNWGLRSGAEYAGAGALVFEHAGYVGSVADPADGVSVAVGAGDSCASTSGCAASGYDYGCADEGWVRAIYSSPLNLHPSGECVALVQCKHVSTLYNL